ncbi:MAG: hypothetical protein ACLTEX_12250 [Eggerthella lenta]
MAGRFGLRALPVAFAAHAALLALLAVSLPAGVVSIANILAVGLLMYVMNSTVQMLFQNVARADYPSALTFSASLHPMSFNAGIARLVRGQARGERGRASPRPCGAPVRPGPPRWRWRSCHDRASQRRKRRRGRSHCGNRPRAEVARALSRRQTLRKGSLLHDAPSRSMPADNTAKVCSCTLLSTKTASNAKKWLTKACN